MVDRMAEHTGREINRRQELLRGLRLLAGLPHVGTVADRQQPDLVRRVVAELASRLERREQLFRDARIVSVEQFRSRRAAGLRLVGCR